MTLLQPGGIDNLRLVDEPRPTIGPRDVLVRICANSLNYHDLYVVRGSIPAADGRVPMSDGAGIVEKVGEQVTDLAPGDHVISTFYPGSSDAHELPGDFSAVPGDGVDGFAAEWVARPADSFTRAPKDYSHSEAATLPCAGLTAWRALVVNGKLQGGQVVLVQGTGGVSIFALQFAKALGAKVVANSSSEEKLAHLRALGADHVINYRTTPQWGLAAQEATGGADHIVEIGGAGTLPQSIAATRNGGHIAIIGVLAGFAGEIPTSAIMRKQLRLIGLTVGSRSEQQRMVEAIEALNLRPVLDRDFALADIGEAFHYQESGKHFGKITISL